MKRLLLSLALLLCCICSTMKAQDWYSSPQSAASMKLYVKQIYQCEGRVFGVDEFSPEAYPLQGANVVVTCVGDTALTDGSSAWTDGSFYTSMWIRDRLKDTRLHIKVTYLGMETLDTIIQPQKSKIEGIDAYVVELDSICLHSEPLTLAEAEVVAELQRMYQHGDTIIFNAGAYEMPTGSVLLDLVRRLPGLKYEDGTLTYLGESIEEIRLNGEHFFERDMSIALNNMPSDKLKSLKVYEVPDDTLNVHSDNHYIMDMETNEPMDKTLFVNAGAGTNEKFNKYQANLGLSAWASGKGDVSAYWNGSNIPDNYQLESDSQYGNLYYNHEFGKTTVGASASYSDNSSRTKNESLNVTYMPDYTQTGTGTSEGFYGSGNWNGNINVSQRIGERVYLNASGGLNGSHSNNESSSTDSLNNEGQGPISTTLQSSKSHSSGHGYNFNINLYTGYSEDSKYSVNASASMNASDSESTSENSSYSHFYQKKMAGDPEKDSTRTIRHLVTSPSGDRRFNTRVSINRELGKDGNGWLGLGYNMSYSENHSEDKYDDILDGALQSVDSLHHTQNYSSIRQGVNLDFTVSDSVYRLNIYGTVTPVVEKYSSTIAGRPESLQQKGLTYNASANLQIKLFKLDQLTFRYSCNSNLPGISSLSSVTDYSDPMNISEGNRNLKGSFNQNVSMEFMLRTWMSANVSYGTTRNSISTLTMIDRETGARRTRPENINGNWNHSERLFFSYPFDDVSLTLNLSHNLRHNVTYVQSFTDSKPSVGESDYRNIGCTLDAGYSNKNWLFRAAASYSKEHNKSNYMEKGNGGQRFGCRSSIEYTSDFGLGAETQFNLDKPFGYELSSANDTECMWDLSANYRFLKSKQAELSLTWHDILNDYDGFDSYVSSTGWSESRTYGYSSMIIISFNYRFNSF